ncbi:PRTRC system protein E [Flavobacterium sp. Sd200]|uniref:PRTRC system protein E n=1 Tax=Flavobacterium sp. Sd200 TaxID=2692211 RepID=UPI00136D8BC7|nr:PRTRC system protein E [Flavobacterium sp. Sd200]MXN91677.1 PRTRC system protein E [Flavobacterium sp. Sd200]
METTDFFTHIAAINFTGELQMVLKKDGEILTVSLLLNNEQCGDKAKTLIPPLILKGTASELDSGFFQQITAPIAETSGLLVNMAAHLKGLEAAKAQSAMEKGKADKERKEAELKDKKYTDALQQAADLEKARKFREAWAKVPDPLKYPEKAEEIRKRRKELSDKFSAPDLFGTAMAQEQQIPAPDETQEEYHEEEYEEEEYENEN